MMPGDLPGPEKLKCETGKIVYTYDTLNNRGKKKSKLR